MWNLRGRRSREPKDVCSYSDGCPGETGATPGEGAPGKSSEHVQQVLPAAFTIPSHVSCLIDKISCPLGSLEMKGTTKYHNFKVETMGQSTVLFSACTCPPRAWRRIGGWYSYRGWRPAEFFLSCGPKDKDMNLNIHIRT